MMCKKAKYFDVTEFYKGVKRPLSNLSCLKKIIVNKILKRAHKFWDVVDELSPSVQCLSIFFFFYPNAFCPV